MKFDELPVAAGLPVLGQTLNWLRDPIGTPLRLRRAHGDAFRHHIFFERPVVFAHPDALGEIFIDAGQDLSTAAGWRPFFGRLMKGGLLLRDHADHREHRGVMASAFSTAALAGYVREMNVRIPALLDRWRGRGRIHAAPMFRQMALELSSVLFLGVEVGPQLDELSRAFEAMVRGVAAVVPWGLPGTDLRRALQARERLVAYLRAEMATRRATPSDDLFGQLCRARDDAGRALRDEEVIDHMLFMWTAAHDTTTGALVMAAYELAREPAWQDRLRAEAASLGDVLTFEAMGEAKAAQWLIQECLRLYPPVGSVPRRTLRACSIAGVELPADTPLRASILLAQRHPQFWTRPHAFDPERFSPARAEHQRHPHAFRPFGHGAHACMGGRFAMMALKCVLHHTLQRFRLALPRGYRLALQPTPSLRPRDDLPLEIEVIPSDGRRR
jgi:cytochrome P450